MRKHQRALHIPKVSIISRNILHLCVCIYLCVIWLIYMHMYLYASAESYKTARCTLNCGSRSNEFVSQLGAGLICFVIYLAWRSRELSSWPELTPALCLGLLPWLLRKQRLYRQRCAPSKCPPRFLPYPFHLAYPEGSVATWARLTRPYPGDL